MWPPDTAPKVEEALARSHVTGPHRTLVQDPVFAIDQLVEIGIRALSPAVNDTFTALTCIDWLSAGLSQISGRELSEGIYFDRRQQIRLIQHAPSYERMVNRAFDKIRQAGGAMPAVVIRFLNAITHVVEHTVDASQRVVLLRQADMILAAADHAVLEGSDRADIHACYEQLISTIAGLDYPRARKGGTVAGSRHESLSGRLVGDR